MSFKKSNTSVSSNPFDDKKYNRLFKVLYTPLCQYCVKFVHKRDVAEDIVQEQFIYLWENWKRLKEIEFIESYLYRSVKNKSINHLNHWFSKPTNPIHADLPVTNFHLMQSDPAEIMEYKEFSNILEEAIERLPEKCRIIFAMKRFGNMSNLEISNKLQISVKTVEAHTTNAIKKLTSVIATKYDVVLMLIITILFF